MSANNKQLMGLPTPPVGSFMAAGPPIGPTLIQGTKPAAIPNPKDKKKKRPVSLLSMDAERG